MTDTPRATRFDLDKTIAARLDRATEGDTETHLQALAVLIDADLSPTERAEAFEEIMGTLLANLSADDQKRFCEIAVEGGEAAAMSYLAAKYWPAR